MPAQKAPSLRYAFGTQMFKYIVFNDPSLGLHAATTSRRGRRTPRTAAIVPERDESEPRRVQGEGPQAAAVARLVGPGADAARQRSSTTTGAGARSEGRRLRADVHDARRAALRRRRRARQRRTGRRRSTTGSRTARRRSGSSRRRSPAGGAVTRTRPLCAYPQHAVYNGSGSTDQAENFVVQARRGRDRRAGRHCRAAPSSCGRVAVLSRRRASPALTRSFDAATDAWERGDYSAGARTATFRWSARPAATRFSNRSR